ncbi:MAG: DUF4132 domain-containing protein [Myxococcota bacterium]
MAWKDFLTSMLRQVGLAEPTPERALMDAWWRARPSEHDTGVDPDTPEARAILDASPELRARIAIEAVRDASAGGYVSRTVWMSWHHRLVETTPLTDAQLVEVVDLLASSRHCPVGAASIATIEARYASGPVPAELTAAVRRLRDVLAGSPDAAHRKRVLRLQPLIGTGEGPGNPFAPDDPWGRTMHAWFAGLPPTDAERWSPLFAHAAKASDKARPTARWEADAEPLLDAVGIDVFATHLVSWLDTVDLLHDRTVQWATAHGPVDANSTLLKGLVWFAIHVPEPEILAALGRFGERAYKKIPNHGAASTKLGNAVVATLGAMPDGRGVAHLTRLQTRVRYGSARTQIDRAMAVAGQRSGHSREDLEELAIPTFGLDASGQRTESLAGFEAVLSIEGDAAKLAWRTAAGKAQKSVPKAVKDAEPDALKRLKAEVKDLTGILASQAHRIERHTLTGRTLALSDLEARYLRHPVVAPIARRLLWWVEPAGTAGVAALWHDGALADLGGNPLSMPPESTARLWHPLLEDPERQVIWRDRIEELGIEQPFPQVWREVYRADEEEPGALASTRFSRVLLDQRRLLDQAQRRGWQYRVQGYFDSANDAVLFVAGLEVVLGVEPIQHTNDQSVFRYVVTHGVQLLAAGGPQALADIDPIVLSEALREVDLLVLSSSVGSSAPDAGFPRGFDWDQLAFGPLTPIGRTRNAVLQRVLPRLAIASACTLDGPWLRVAGPDGESRIHLGSGQVQREGRHVAVSADRAAIQAAQKAFLPFEGDPALPAILATAHALASGRGA